MSILCAIEKSMGGSLLHTSIRSRQYLPFLYPLEVRLDMRNHTRSISQKTTDHTVPSNRTKIDSWFFDSLVRVSQCHRHVYPATDSTYSLRRRPTVSKTAPHPSKGSTCRTYFTQAEKTNKNWTNFRYVGSGSESKRSAKVRLKRKDHRPTSKKSFVEPEGLEAYPNTQDLAKNTPRDSSPLKEHDVEPEDFEAYPSIQDLAKNIAQDSSPLKEHDVKPEDLGVYPNTQDLAKNTTREELLELVEEYGPGFTTDQLPLLRAPNLRQPGSTVSEEPPLSSPDNPTRVYKWPATGADGQAVSALETTLERAHVSAEEVWDLYRALPAPRITYLGYRMRGRLLHHLSVVERKTEIAMLRYFSVIEDMKAQGIPLRKSEWTTAISFAGRHVATTTEVEVEVGLAMWREMEHDAKVEANHVTFNVLFEMASKAGKFKLAGMIYAEMKNRGYALNRYHYVSMIHHHGLIGDAMAVRRAYRDMVEAGEVVDTVILNCVISALLKAHEPQSAELVYERMKRLHEQQENRVLSPTNFRVRRKFAKSLTANYPGTQPHEKYQPSLWSLDSQSTTLIAPDEQTYHLLVSHFAVQAGDLDKTLTYVYEMDMFGLQPNGAIYRAIFNGFAVHCGIRYTDWTLDRLEDVYSAYIEALREKHPDIYVTKWIIIWILRAYIKSAGSARTIEVWQELEPLWTRATPNALNNVQSVLNFILGRASQQ
jgi:pentatricopeptide repeat protein